jgi:hypothetical protein
MHGKGRLTITIEQSENGRFFLDGPESAELSSIFQPFSPPKAAVKASGWGWHSQRPCRKHKGTITVSCLTWRQSHCTVNIAGPVPKLRIRQGTKADRLSMMTRLFLIRSEFLKVEGY